MEYQKVTITLPKNLQDDYRKLLEKFGMNLSSRIAVLIQEDYKILSKRKPLTLDEEKIDTGIRKYSRNIKFKT